MRLTKMEETLLRALAAGDPLSSKFLFEVFPKEVRLRFFRRRLMVAINWNKHQVLTPRGRDLLKKLGDPPWVAAVKNRRAAA